jgi:RimJ/RimL family protein N-acetyltransferase
MRTPKPWLKTPMNALVDSVAPDVHAVSAWASRLRQNEGPDAARLALRSLCERYPANTALAALYEWNDPLWWHSFHFGGIRLERRGPQHFDFVWSVVQNREFARRLKQIPVGLTPAAVLDTLNQDAISLLSERHNIQWVVFRGEVPIGLSMFVNINFRNRTAEQIMGILPGFDVSFSVGDAYCASLLFAFNCLGLNKVQGLIYSNNESIALQQERLGFRREGLLRKAIWDEEHNQYKDLVQIALLREDFVTNRVLQRHIRRQPHDALLDRFRSVARPPLKPAPG